jgi:hypothetical protein
MKKTSLLLTLIALYTLTSSSTCHKSNQPTNVLPPETHAGLNTMGCDVDGQLFIPQYTGSNPNANYYGASLTSAFPAYSLFLSWQDKPTTCGGATISIYLDSVHLIADTTYLLSTSHDTSNIQDIYFQWAFYEFDQCNNGLSLYRTSAQMTGQLTISYFDPTVGIVAGTFAYDAVDVYGDTVHIQNGRFDMALH